MRNLWCLEKISILPLIISAGETPVIMLISTALLLDSNIRNRVCAKLPCHRVVEGVTKSWPVTAPGSQGVFRGRGRGFGKQKMGARQLLF
jgi:hypothetical protein